MHDTNITLHYITLHYISAWQALMDAVGGWICQGQTRIRNKQMEGGGPPAPLQTPPPSPSSNAGRSLSWGTGKVCRLTLMANLARQWWCFCQDFFSGHDKAINPLLHVHDN